MSKSSFKAPNPPGSAIVVYCSSSSHPEQSTHNRIVITFQPQVMVTGVNKKAVMYSTTATTMHGVSTTNEPGVTSASAGMVTREMERLALKTVTHLT